MPKVFTCWLGGKLGFEPSFLMLMTLSSSTMLELCFCSGHLILRKTLTVWNMSRGQVAKPEGVQEKMLPGDKASKPLAWEAESLGDWTP